MAYSYCKAGLIFIITIFVALSCSTRINDEIKPLFSANQVSAVHVGDEICVGCHQVENSHWTHTVHAKAFRAKTRDKLPSKGCETCHGAGSEHLTNTFDKTKITTFTRSSGVTIRQQNAVCLQCHRGGSQIFWEGSIHQVNDLGCSDCHNPMAQFSTSGLLARQGISQTCFTCHSQQHAEFRKRSHMPLLEGKMTCVDCHNPHGSATPPLLQADSVNQVCYRCHAEKRGPFIWEHAPVREDCLNCHRPHGSNYEFLLITASPFLCQQCHTNRGHPNDLLTTVNLPRGSKPDARIMNRSCQNCHAQIHGSNHPSGVRFHR